MTFTKLMSGANISKPQQFNHENKTWERLLDFFKQENTILKTRLSEVVDYKIDREFLAWAEQFQNQFIIKDEFIDELRHDVHEQQTLLAACSDNEDYLEKGLLKKQLKLRNEMEFLEKDFSNIKNGFNKYLASIL